MKRLVGAVFGLRACVLSVCLVPSNSVKYSSNIQFSCFALHPILQCRENAFLCLDQDLTDPWMSDFLQVDKEALSCGNGSLS